MDQDERLTQVYTSQPIDKEVAIATLVQSWVIEEMPYLFFTHGNAMQTANMLHTLTGRTFTVYELSPDHPRYDRNECHNYIVKESGE